MTARIRRFRRFATYTLLLTIASILSLFGQKRDDGISNEYSLIPPAPMAHADTPPVDGGGSTLDTESTSCSSNGDGPACTDGGDSADGGSDGCCGSGCAGGE